MCPLIILLCLVWAFVRTRYKLDKNKRKKQENWKPFSCLVKNLTCLYPFFLFSLNTHTPYNLSFLKLPQTRNHTPNWKPKWSPTNDILTKQTKWKPKNTKVGLTIPPIPMGMNMTVTLNANGVGLDSTLSAAPQAASTATAISTMATAVAAAAATTSNPAVSNVADSSVPGSTGANLKVDLWESADSGEYFTCYLVYHMSRNQNSEKWTISFDGFVINSKT